MTALHTGMLNDVSILSLRCFVAVVETHSFSAAARQLRLAPSSVTKHVQSLETAMNVALVHRTTRRISVTDAGERFYLQCLEILAQIDSAAAVMVAERELSGHLRVAAPPSFAASMLSPHIHAFLADHPGLSVYIMVTSAVPDLIRDRIDVAITVQEAPESKLEHIPLASSPRVLCASPGYLARCGTPERPEDLFHHECLSARFSELAEAWHLRRAGGEWQTVHVRSRLLSDNGDLLRQACIMGSGITNPYEFHVRDDLAAGRLVRVLPDHEVKPRTIYAVIPHRHIIRPQTKAFIAFLRGLSGCPAGAGAADRRGRETPAPTRTIVW